MHFLLCIHTMHAVIIMPISFLWQPHFVCDLVLLCIRLLFMLFAEVALSVQGFCSKNVIEVSPVARSTQNGGGGGIICLPDARKDCPHVSFSECALFTAALR